MAVDFQTAVIPPRKLVDYLLATDHPEGGSKAAFFLACGFSADAPDRLDFALRQQAQGGEATAIATGFGMKYVVEGPLLGVDGRSRRLRSVWIVETDGEPPRFVTAYPLEMRP